MLPKPPHRANAQLVSARADMRAQANASERANHAHTSARARTSVRTHAPSPVWYHCGKRCCIDLARQLAFKDVDGDGDVDADDVLAMFDKDGDGKLDAAEIAVLLRFGPLPPTPAPGLRDPSTMGSELVPRILLCTVRSILGHLVLTGTGGGNQGDE